MAVSYLPYGALVYSTDGISFNYVSYPAGIVKTATGSVLVAGVSRAYATNVIQSAQTVSTNAAAVASDVGAFTSGDFAGTGQLDTAAFQASGSSNSLTVAWGITASGSSTQTTTVHLPGSITGLTTAGRDSSGNAYFASIEPSGTGGTTVRTFQIDPTGASSAPTAVRAYSLASTATAIASADLDHDGIPDLVVANSDGSLDIFSGTGQGAFANPTVIDVGTDLTGLAVADMNRDGFADIVATDSAGHVDVLLNLGNGSFASPVSYAAGNDPLGLAVGDLDGDGRPDVAVADGDGQVTTLLNDGTGHLTGAQSYSSALGQPTGGEQVSTGGAGTPSSGTPDPVAAVSIADVDGNGVPDLILTGADGSTSVLEGAVTPATVTALAVSPDAGSGAATSRTDLKAGRVLTFTLTTSAPVVATVNGVYPLLQLSNGGQAAYASGLGTNTLTFTYKVAANDDTNDVRVLTFDDNGSGLGVAAVQRFNPGATVKPGSNPSSLLQADLNGDGIGDLVAVEGAALNGLLGQGSSYVAGPTGTLPFTPVGVGTGAFAGDGTTDLAAASANGTILIETAGKTSFSTASTYYLEQSGSGKSLTYRLSTTAPSSSATAPSAGATTSGPTWQLVTTVSQAWTGDFTGDGHTDVVVESSTGGTGTLYLLQGDGAGHLSLAAETALTSVPTSGMVASLSGDGTAELVLSVGSSFKVMGVTAKTGGGLTFGSLVTSNSLGAAVAATATLSPKGVSQPDVLALTSSGSILVEAYAASPSSAAYAAGTYSQVADVFVGLGLVGAATGKFGTDGNIDIAAVQSNGTVSLYDGDGNSNFSLAGTFTVPLASGATATGVSVADVNGDGKPDLLIQESDGTVATMLDASVASYTFSGSTLGSIPAANTLVQVDTVSPTVSISLANDTGASSTDLVTSSATLTGSGDPNAVVTLTGSGIVNSTTVTADAQGGWSYTPTGLGQGTQTFEATETDQAGNVGTASLTFTYDTTPPTPTAHLLDDTGSNATDGITNDPTLTGTGDANTVVSAIVQKTISDPSSLKASGAAAYYTSHPDEAPHTFTTTSGSTGTWTLTPTGLSDGLYNVTVSETDVAGNVGTTTTQFTLDTTPPAISARLLNDTGSNAYDGVTSDPTITGIGLANTGLTVVVDNNVPAYLSTNSTGAFQYYPPGLAPGQHVVTVSETDAAGNVGQTTVSLTLQGAPQSSTVALLHDTGSNSADGVTSDPTLTGTGIANASVKILDGPLSFQVQADASGDWTFKPTGLAQGYQTAKVIETDAIGDTASATVSFTLDNLKPAVQIAPVPAPASASGTVWQPVVAGTGDAKATVSLTAGAQTYTTVADATGHWSYTFASIPTGAPIVVSASETDRAGNVSTAATELVPVSSVSTMPSGAVVKAGATVTFALNVGQSVTVNGSPTLSLSDGGTATYDPTASSGTSLVFATQVTSSQNSADLAVTSFSLNGGSIVAAPVTSFAPAAPTTASAAAITKLAADVNGDGSPDDVVVTQSGKVSVALSDGHGGYLPATLYSAGTSVTSIAVGDLNGDGALDIAAAGPSGITLLLNDGSGSFTPAATLSTGTAVSAVSILPSARTGYSDVVAAETGTTVKFANLSTPAGQLDPSSLLGTTAGVLSGVTVDNTAPKVTLALAGTAAADGSVPTPAVTGTGDPSASVTIADGAARFTTTADELGRWSYTPTGLSQGAQTITATETDAAGNTGSASLAFTLKTPAPKVTVGLADDTGSNPSDGITSDPTLTGRANPLSTVKVTVSGSTYTTSTDASGTWTLKPTALIQGYQTVFATQTDAQNRTGSASMTFTYASTPPVLTMGLKTITSNDPTTNTTSDATLIGTAAAGASVTVTDGSQTFGTVANSGGTWNLQLTGIVQGVQTAFAQVTDAANNTSATSVTFNYDSVKPTVSVSLLHATGGQNNPTSDPTVTGTGDPNAVVTLVDGAKTYTATANAAGIWSFVPTGLLDGRQTLTATETDAAGNVGQASLSFVLDTHAPSLTIGLAQDTGVDPAADVTANAALSGTSDPNAIVTIVDKAGTFTTTADTHGNWSVAQPNLPQGLQVATATETDAAGNIGSATLSFTLDTVAPQPTVALLHDTGAYAADGTTSDPTLTGTGDPNAVVTITDGSATFVTRTSASGQWTLTPTGVPQGQQTAVVSQTDAAGNVGTSSVAFDLINQGPKPTVTLLNDSGTSPTDLLTDDARLTGTGNANARVTVTDGSQTFITTADGSGAWTVTPTNLAQGLQTAIVTETDLAGNVGTASLAFTYDTSSPDVIAAVAHPTGGSGAAPVTSDPTLQGSGDPNALVTLTGSGQRATTVANASGAWSYTPTGLPQGAQTFTVSETDAAGNVGSAVVPFTLDTVAPAVTVGLAHDTGAGGTDGVTADPTLAGSGDPNAVVYITDAAGTFATKANPQGNWSFVPTNLSQGAQTASVTETDAAGNVGQKSIAFTLDSVNPVPSIALLDDTGASASDRITNDPTLTGTADPNATVTIADGALNYQTAADPSGHWVYRPAGVSVGAQSATVTETDLAGNTGSASLPFTYDPTSPVLTIASGAGLTNQTSQVISGSVQTPGAGTAYVAGSTVVLSDNGTVIGSAAVNGDGSWSTRADLLGNGTNVVKAALTDQTGNAVASTVNYTLNTNAPVISISNLAALTSSRAQTISGQVTTPGAGVAFVSGSTIQLTDNGVHVGSALVDAGGNWSTGVSVSGDGAHSITASDTDAMGNSGSSGSAVFSLDTTGPVLNYASNAAFATSTATTLNGTVADPSAVAGVELYNGATDLGAAAIGPSGAWSFTTDLGQGDFNALAAVATDSLGNKSLTAAPYELVTGITGAPFASQEYDHDPSGNLTGIESYNARGGLVMQSSTNADGTHNIYATRNYETLQSWSNDVMQGNGVGDAFVFSSSFGHDEITDFAVSGWQHDSLDLSQTGLTSLAQVLAHTTMSNGNAVINVTPNDTITLDGITKTQLKWHPADFRF